AGGLWTATKLALIKQFARKPELHAPALLRFSASSVADMGITVGLVWTLVSCLGVLGLEFRCVEDAEERARGDGWTGCFVEEWSEWRGGCLGRRENPQRMLWRNEHGGAAL
ncbi:hypothetical protein K438DRAFT_1613052, partial [Mycena galopus ATCC 62051]